MSESTPTTGSAASAADADEVERLRARVAQLEHEQAQARGPRWRTALALVLLLIGGLIFPVGLVGIWAQRTVNNTDRYVATVAPLLADAQVQNVLADQITDGLFNQVDISTLLAEVLPPRAAVLSGPIESGLEKFVRSEVLKALETPVAQEAWARANARLQEQIIAALKGQDAGAVSVVGDTIVLDTGDLLTQVKQILVQRGFTFLEKVPLPPQADRQIVLIQSDQITSIQSIYRLANIASSALVWIALALIFGAVLVGNRHRRWLLAAGVVIAVGAGVVGLALVFGREAALTSIGAADPSFQASVFDILTRFLQGLARAGVALGIVIAVAAWLAGPSAFATGIRSGVVAAERALARAVVRYVPQVAGFGRWVGQWRSGFRVVIIGLAILSIFGRADISAGRIVWTFALSLLAWLIVDTVAATGDAGTPRSLADDEDADAQGELVEAAPGAADTDAAPKAE
jgi:hypothetical protein